MKLIIPLARKGSMLRPLTNEVPKPLVRVAGKPVLDYVMETVSDLDIEIPEIDEAELQVSAGGMK